MILLADSGSTKCDWRFLDEQKQLHQFNTKGLNAYVMSEEDVRLVLEKGFPDHVKQQVTTLYFYGAGCGHEENNAKMERAFRAVFPNVKHVEVQNDLIGACRATSGNRAGLVGILGTGSNSCFYDGKQVVDQVPALGFIAGDDGAGVSIGKALVRAYCYRKMPEDLAARFAKDFKQTPEEVKHELNSSARPNAYLASFTPFASRNVKSEFIQSLLVENFRVFFREVIQAYPQARAGYPLHLVGSVAFHFGDWIRDVGAEEGVAIGTVIEKPIAALSLFHKLT